MNITHATFEAGKIYKIWNKQNALYKVRVTRVNSYGIYGDYKYWSPSEKKYRQYINDGLWYFEDLVKVQSLKAKKL